MPAPLLQASVIDAASPSEKSNSWSAEQRMDIFNRRQQGEKWDTIIVDYPNRSKHAMQQQYSIMKKQAVLKTPTKPSGRRRKASPILPTNLPSASKRAYKRKVDSDLTDPSDAESDKDSTEYVATKTTGGNDGALETDEEPESPKEPDSARKKRLSKRLQKAPVEDDEPASSRPKRTRASGINYNVLQNSGYDQDDSGEIVATDTAVDVPVRKSKIIALRTGFPRTPVLKEPDFKPKRLRKSLNIDVDDDATRTPNLQEDGSTRRMSTRGRKFINGKSDYLPSPLSFAADEETNSGSRRKARLHGQAPEASPDVGSDSKATRSSRKRKNSDFETNQSRPRKVTALGSTRGYDDDHPGKGHTKKKAKEHLGFLPNGQPRQRRRRRTRAEIETELKTPTSGTTRRRSEYQFPFLQGYNGPPPPDLATVMAHQEEQERQNPPPDLESDFDSTSSSLMSLDDEDDNLENQPQMSDIVSNEEAVSPLTRPTADGQLPNDSGPVTVVPPSSLQRAPLAMMDTTNIAEYILSAEDIEKARENARRLQAARELEKTTYEDTVQASANALATRISENNGLTQELEDIRKVNSGFTLEIATLRESLGTKQEEKERLTACEAALTEEKQRNEELQQEIDKTRRESKIEIEEMMKKITLNAVSNMDKNSPLPIADNNDLAQAHERVRELEEETRHFKDEIIALQAERDEQETEIGSLDATKVKLEAENTKLHRRYTATKARIEQLLNERKHTPAMTDGGADLTNAKASGDATSFFTAPSPISTAVKPPSAAPTALLSHPTTPTTAPTFSKQTLLPLLTTLRQSHIRLAGHIRNAAEEHTPLHASLKKCHQTLEEGEISMREVKRVVKEVVEGSEKVGKGLKGARDGIEVVKGGIMNVWDEVSGPQG